MSPDPSLISELDEALKCGTSSQRVEALRRVTDLFLSRSDAFEGEHVELFDDVLGRMIEHIESKVLTELGATFSSGGYAGLVKRAEHDDTLAEVVGRRADIPLKLFKELLEKATETVRARLKEYLPAELADGAVQKLRRIASELAPKPKVPTRNYTSAQFLTKLMHREGRLGGNEIHEFARDNRFEEAVAALALRASAQIDIIERLMDAGHIEALLIPCKAAGLTWSTVRSLMQLHANHSKTSEEKFATMRRDFLKLSAPSAQRILRFWQVRSNGDGTWAN